MTNPWDIFWEAEKYTGKTALLSEPRETIAMALLRKHHYDINTEDPKLINAALNDLQQLYNICSIKVGDQQYSNIPEGLAYLNQAWSGDMMSAYFYYLPKGTPASVLGFWRPERGKGPVQNDCWSICSTTKKPVLAASVAELHARLRQRLLELRELQRLPAADEGAQSGGPGQEQGDPRITGDVRSDRGRLRPQTRCRR